MRRTSPVLPCKMYLFKALLLSLFTFAVPFKNITKEEWKTGIDQLFADLAEGYRTKNMTALKAIRTDDLKVYGLGALRREIGSEIDLGWHDVKVLHVNYNWDFDRVAAAEYVLMGKYRQNDKHMEIGIALVVDVGGGVLKFSGFYANYVF